MVLHDLDMLVIILVLAISLWHGTLSIPVIIGISSRLQVTVVVLAGIVCSQWDSRPLERIFHVSWLKHTVRSGCTTIKGLCGNEGNHIDIVFQKARNTD